jgi:radical SAM superfamily enzyme YgiQ (UPF0313 family)
MSIWGKQERGLDMLLVNTPLSDYGVIPGHNTVYWPPMGLAYLASYLDKKGFNVAVLDADAEKMSPEQLAETVAKISPKVVGYNTFTPAETTLQKIVRLNVQESPNTRVVLGGIDATVRTANLLRMDYLAGVIVVRNDGEKKMEKILRGDNIENIPGVGFTDSRGIIITPEDSKWFVNIDDGDCQLDRRFVPFDPTQGGVSPDGKKRVFLASSRGCPYRCTFCASSELAREGSRARYRRDDLVAEEMIDLAERGFPDQKLNDDLALRDKGRIEGILDPIVRAGYGRDTGLQVRGNGRANIIRRLPNEHLDLMASVGVATVGMGGEQGTKKGMAAIKKQQTPEDLLIACDRLTSRGMVPSINFMFGLPTQNRRETMAVVALARELVLRGKRNGVQVQLDGYPLRPYPGTAIYDQLRKEGFSHEEISRSEHVEIKPGEPGYKQVLPARHFGGTPIEEENEHRRVFASLTELNEGELEKLQNEYPLSLSLDE